MGWWSLAADLATARVLAWAATFGRDAELSDEAHLYFFDRYRRLAVHHRARGRLIHSRRVEAKAQAHWRPGADPGGPPYAAAMAMPRPRHWTSVDAISHPPSSGPGDDAA